MTYAGVNCNTLKMKYIFIFCRSAQDLQDSRDNTKHLQEIESIKIESQKEIEKLKEECEDAKLKVEDIELINLYVAPFSPPSFHKFYM